MQEIQLDIFRPKSFSKGTKLCTSCHVSNVYEEIDIDHFQRIFGKVLRETPGQNSSKNNTSFYNVVIEVSIEL